MPGTDETADDTADDTAAALPTSPPPTTPETQPYFDALAEGRIELPVCDACGHWIFYPRSFCPVCGCREVTWREASGRGTVYSCTVPGRRRGGGVGRRRSCWPTSSSTRAPG